MWHTACIKPKEEGTDKPGYRQQVAQRRFGAVESVSVLDKLPTPSDLAASPPHTPSHQIKLDLLLLQSSQPDDAELRQANTLLNVTIQVSRDIPSPAERHTTRMSRAFELTHSGNVTLRKQLKDAERLLNTRKIRKTGNAVAPKGRFVFST